MSKLGDAQNGGIPFGSAVFVKAKVYQGTIRTHTHTNTQVVNNQGLGNST